MGVLLAAVLALTGCTGAAGRASSNRPADASAGSVLQTEESTQSGPESAADTGTTGGSVGGAVISTDNIPVFSGEPAITINGNIPFFEDSELSTVPTINLSPLDSRGRAQTASAVLGWETLAQGDRENINSYEPSGWQQSTYDFIEGDFLYNRCHLLMWKLCGIEDDHRNLITGTRSLNIHGMLPYEEEVLDEIESTGFHVLYRVTPVYDGDNLLASGVLMEAKSVEDRGRSLQFCIYSYNVQPGVQIDYATGDNYADNDSVSADSTDGAGAVIRGIPPSDGGSEPKDYVLNTSRHKFHYPDCPSVRQMKDKNKAYVTASREELIAEGYDPCGNCRP